MKYYIHTLKVDTTFICYYIYLHLPYPQVLYFTVSTFFNSSQVLHVVHVCSTDIRHDICLHVHVSTCIRFSSNFSTCVLQRYLYTHTIQLCATFFLKNTTFITRRKLRPGRNKPPRFQTTKRIAPSRFWARFQTIKDQLPHVPARDSKAHQPTNT